MSDIHFAPRAPFFELRLQRPPLNVLNLDMLVELRDVLTREAATINRSHGLILSAEGKAFSAGVDVGDHLGERAARMLRVFHEAVVGLWRLEVPIVALVQGTALGGGWEWAMGADVILVSDKAVIGQPEIKVGVVPPIAAAMLPSLVGWKRAADLILTGRTWDARRAREAGLVTEVYPADTFAADAEAYVAGLASLSRPVLKHALAAMRLAGRSADELKARLDQLETMYLKELMATQDAQEGLEAFMHKRQPVWTHR